MREAGVLAKANIVGEVQDMRSGRCKNNSYYRKFSLNYRDSYRDKNTGELVNVDMRQWIIGFNDVARKIKSDVAEGDTVYIEGRLKSREIVNHTEEVFIEVEELEDIIVCPSMEEIWKAME
jgi:single-stranded DNA-binding protein